MSSAPVQALRLWGDEPNAAAHAGRPDRVVATVWETWWARRAQAAGLPCEWRQPSRALDPLHERISADPDPTLADASPTALGEAYVASLEASERLRHGRHYTPERLAGSLWAELGAAGTGVGGTVFDPAAGAGALLIDEVRRLVAKFRDAPRPEAAIDAIAARVSGRDSDPTAVWLGNALLAGELLPLWARVDSSPAPATAEAAARRGWTGGRPGRARAARSPSSIRPTARSASIRRRARGGLTRSTDTRIATASSWLRRSSARHPMG